MKGGGNVPHRSVLLARALVQPLWSSDLGCSASRWEDPEVLAGGLRTTGSGIWRPILGRPDPLPHQPVAKGSSRFELPIFYYTSNEISKSVLFFSFNLILNDLLITFCFLISFLLVNEIS